jgi:hypothetical protein
MVIIVLLGQEQDMGRQFVPMSGRLQAYGLAGEYNKTGILIFIGQIFPKPTSVKAECHNLGIYSDSILVCVAAIRILFKVGKQARCKYGVLC